MPFVPLAKLLYWGTTAVIKMMEHYDESEANERISKEKDRTIRLLAEGHPSGDTILSRRDALPVAFISYAYDDADLADEVKEFLETSKLGIGVEKLDPQSLLGKHDLNQELTDHVERSTFVIPVCTYCGNRSEWVQKEITRALECGNSKGLPRVIPIVIDEEGLFTPLRGIPYITASGGFTKRVQRELHQYINKFG
jgi:hypothetical protein